jgi:precorrin-6Y C5,15-methyltransferase (decarboxylating)
MRTVTVVGCLSGPPAPAAEALKEATLVVGAARHLSMVDSPAERVVLGDVAAAVARLAAHDGPAVVLASGDPGFFGILRALRRAGVRAEVVPAPSSVAIAFARVGLPWDDALVVSAHGRALAPAVNACRAHPKVAVLTGPGTGPAELARALFGVPRRMVVAESLGAPDERVVETSPAEAAAATWREPNVVLVLSETPADTGSPPWVAGHAPGPGRWALPDGEFAHRMITRAEVRALALARLGPRLGDLVWDVGAGSGSIGVECARFGAAVLAVERDPAARATIADNARRHGVEVCVVPAEAPDCLADLPDPDAVFVGGGGLAVLGTCAARRPGRLVAAYAAVERVGPALTALAGAGYRAEGVQVAASRLAPLPDGTHRLAATNPVYLVSGVPA